MTEAAYPLLIDLLKSTDFIARRHGVEALALFRRSAAAASIGRLISDENESVRYQVALALAELGSVDTIKDIEEQLNRESEERPKYFFSQAIKRIRLRQ